MKWWKRGPNWAQLGIVVVVLAGLVVVSPALGGPSLRDLVKQEVSKQLASSAKKKSKRGPQGLPGTNGQNGTDGTNGTNGAAGTARAYATVPAPFTNPCGAGGCAFNHAKGITSITQPLVGRFCISAPGVDSATTSAAATVEHGTSATPSGNANATVFTAATNCPAGQFEVITFRHLAVTVQGFPSGTQTVEQTADSANGSNDVGFTVVIP